MSKPLFPWPLIFAYDRAADTFHSTKIDGRKVLVAFADLDNFRRWKGAAEPVSEAEPVRIIPVLRLMHDAGGNEKLAVMYWDPPGKWRAVQYDLAAIIDAIEQVAG